MGKLRPSLVPLNASPFSSSFPHTRLKVRKWCQLAGAHVFARHIYLPECRMYWAKDKHSSRHHRTDLTQCCVTDLTQCCVTEVLCSQSGNSQDCHQCCAQIFCRSQTRHETQRKGNSAIPSQTRKVLKTRNKKKVFFFLLF